MRRLIEEVTCDRCGQIFRFEKLGCYNPGIYRVENLSDWLKMLGWNGSNGRVQGDFCPKCAEQQRPRKVELPKLDPSA